MSWGKHELFHTPRMAALDIVLALVSRQSVDARIAYLPYCLKGLMPFVLLGFAYRKHPFLMAMRILSSKTIFSSSPRPGSASFVMACSDAKELSPDSESRLQRSFACCFASKSCFELSFFGLSLLFLGSTEFRFCSTFFSCPVVQLASNPIVNSSRK